MLVPHGTAPYFNGGSSTRPTRTATFHPLMHYAPDLPNRSPPLLSASFPRSPRNTDLSTRRILEDFSNYLHKGGFTEIGVKKRISHLDRFR